MSDAILFGIATGVDEPGAYTAVAVVAAKGMSLLLDVAVMRLAAGGRLQKKSSATNPIKPPAPQTAPMIMLVVAATPQKGGQPRSSEEGERAYAAPGKAPGERHESTAVHQAHQRSRSDHAKVRARPVGRSGPADGQQ